MPPESASKSPESSSSSRIDTAKLSCNFCRSRKVRCRTSTFGAPACDQCTRHGETCTYLQHQRGRKLGSKNIKRNRFGEAAGASMVAADSPASTGFTRVPSLDTKPEAVTMALPNANEIIPGFGVHTPIWPSTFETSPALPISPNPVSLSEDGNRIINLPPVGGGPIITNSSSTLAVTSTHRAPLAMLSRTFGSDQFTYPGATKPHLGGNRFCTSLDVDANLDPIGLGMCGVETATALFELFWQRIANYVAILDRRLHTLPYVRQNSSFLLAVILYTAARHTSDHVIPRSSVVASVLERHLYSTIWPRILTSNCKSVHICQACMLWATFYPETRPGEDDLGWTLFGHAIRIAVEIGLNCTPPVVPADDHDGIAVRNGERVWLTCFIADRSWATQLGRPPMIAEDSRFLQMDEWLESKVSTLEDYSIVALVKLRRIMAQAQSQASDPSLVSSFATEALREWRTTWVTESHRESFRLGHLGQVYYHYANIILRLQWLCQPNSDRRGNEMAAIEHASDLLEYAATSMPTDVYQYAHNNAFTMLSFGVAVLLQFKDAMTDSTTLTDKVAYYIRIILHALREAAAATPHKQGVSRWHAELFEKALSRWDTQTMDLDWEIMRMASTTFPADLLDFMCWDVPWEDPSFAEGTQSSIPLQSS